MGKALQRSPGLPTSDWLADLQSGYLLGCHRRRIRRLLQWYPIGLPGRSKGPAESGLQSVVHDIYAAITGSLVRSLAEAVTGDALKAILLSVGTGSLRFSVPAFAVAALALPFLLLQPRDFNLACVFP